MVQSVVCLVLPIVAGVLILGSYAMGHVFDVEDFNATALTTKLFMDSLLQGDNPFWTSLLGLGLPQPFRISYIQHPLGVLFGVLPAVTAVKVLIIAQGIMAAVSVYLLGRRLLMPPAIASVCAFTFLLCSGSLQYLHIDDWFSSFTSFCFFPLIVLLIVQIGQEHEPTRARLLGVALGTIVGIFVATGLISYTFSIALIATVFALAQPAMILRRVGSLLIALVMTVLIASGIFWLLISELQWATGDVVRSSHHNPEVWQHIHGALGLAILALFDTTPFDALTQAVRAESLRTIGFGAVAAVAALAALFVDLGRSARPFKIAFVGAIGLMWLPPEVFGRVVTATWVFRDGVNLFGIILFGVLASRVLQGFGARGRLAVLGACALHVVWVTALALPLVARTAMFDPTDGPSRPTVAGLEHPGSLIEQLRTLAPPEDGRLVMSRDLADQVLRRRLFRDGVVANTLALHGYQVVSAWARGISTGALYPDMALLEGIVSATDGNLTDRAFLDVLGIATVLTWEGEAVDPSLQRRGTIETLDGRRIVVWHNPKAWPAAVALRHEPAIASPTKGASCGHDRFLCADFSSLHAAAAQRPVAESASSGGTIAIRIDPADEATVLLVNTWYRPAWRAVQTGADVFPLGGQLIGVRVPAGLSSITLQYCPTGLITCYLIGTLAIIVGAMVLMGLGLRRRQRVAPAPIAGRPLS